MVMLLDPCLNMSRMLLIQGGENVIGQNYEMPSIHKNNYAQVYTCRVLIRSDFCLAYLYKCQVYGQAVFISAGYSPIPFKVPSVISYICQVYGLFAVFNFMSHS